MRWLPTPTMFASSGSEARPEQTIGRTNAHSPECAVTSPRGLVWRHGSCQVILTGLKVIDPESLPTDPLDALRELSRADVELEALRRERVEAARRQGATWDQIGESLGMSRQSAWEYYTRETRRVLDQSAAGSDLDEDVAMRVATEEVTRVRRRRRTSSS